MSQQEMDQMDREVMAMVNDRRMVQEIAMEPAASRNDNGDESEQIPQQSDDVEAEGAEKSADEIATTAVQPRNDRAGKFDPEKRLVEKNGMYCIPKEDFHAIDAAAKQHSKTKNAVCITACLVIMGVLLLAFCRPELVNYIVAGGVVGCSVTIGMCLERLVEVNR